MAKQKDNGSVHVNGPGLKVLSRERWYGPGYCGICGHRGESLEPRAVRWWDADDGWRMGVLCVGCGIEAAARGPRDGDYAVQVQKREDADVRIDTAVQLGDLDGACSTEGEG